MSESAEPRVKIDGALVSIEDARELTFDKMVFGVGYLKATDERQDGEVVYRRVPVSDVQGDWYQRDRFVTTFKPGASS